MKKNGRIVTTVAIIAVVVLCLATIVTGGVILNNYLTQAVAEEPVTDEPVADEPVADVTEEPKMIGSISDPDEDTYFPELSCSHLASCQITEVPKGYFTIGFADNGNGCDWVLFDEGESIDYTNLDEIHTYNNLLPLTKLEAFVASQFQYVHACTVNN
jgi:hypothetical protein